MSVTEMPAASGVAHDYGSVAGELAACVKRVGLADRPDLDVLELRGADAWLDHGLSKAIGNRAPVPGRAIQIANAWCCRIAAGHAIVVGPPPSVGRWRRIARESVVAGSPVTSADLRSIYAGASLIGPRAWQLLARAGLPADLDVGAVRAGSLGRAPAIVLRECEERFLLLAGATPDELWRQLYQAGRPLGLARVGRDALERLTAAERHRDGRA
jgi:glycine cleavage system aminomethyltransferase T